MTTDGRTDPFSAAWKEKRKVDEADVQKARSGVVDRICQIDRKRTTDVSFRLLASQPGSSLASCSFVLLETSTQSVSLLPMIHPEK